MYVNGVWGSSISMTPNTECCTYYLFGSLKQVRGHFILSKLIGPMIPTLMQFQACPTKELVYKQRLPKPALSLANGWVITTNKTAGVIPHPWDSFNGGSTKTPLPPVLVGNYTLWFVHYCNRHSENLSLRLSHIFHMNQYHIIVAGWSA